MNVTINGVSYEGIWDTDTFSMETDMTLAQIEEAFIPGASTDIIVEDGNQEIARYYNKGISSITVSGGDPRTVNVRFDLTQITPNAEAEIREDIEDSDGAIVELAELVGELSEMDVPSMSEKLNTLDETIVDANLPKIIEDIQSHQETINTWFSSASEIMQFINQLRMEDGILDHIDARLTALEHAIGNVSYVSENQESAGE